MKPQTVPRQKLTHLQAWLAFEAAARSGSFAAAAEELSVTPAAISQHVRSLEEYLGVRLFTRTGQGVALTPEGRQAYPGVRDGFQKVADAVHRLQHRELDRIVRVSAPPSFASHWMLPRLHRFNRLHPALSVNLDATPRLVDFYGENIDVAIRYGRGQYPGLQSELVFEEFVFPVCSPMILRHEPLKAPLEVLQHIPLLHDTTAHLESDMPTWRSWLAQQGVAGIDCDRGLHLPSVLAVQAAVDGRGMLLGRSVVVADDLAAGRLVRPFDLAQKVPRAYFLVMPPERVDAPKVVAFRSWLLEEAMLTRASEILVTG